MRKAIPRQKKVLASVDRQIDVIVIKGGRRADGTVDVSSDLFLLPVATDQTHLRQYILRWEPSYEIFVRAYSLLPQRRPDCETILERYLSQVTADTRLLDLTTSQHRRKPEHPLQSTEPSKSSPNTSQT